MLFLLKMKRGFLTLCHIGYFYFLALRNKIRENAVFPMQKQYIQSLLSGEILPQRKLSRTITLRNISSEVGLIKYIFDVASFEEDLTNRV